MSTNMVYMEDFATVGEEEAGGRFYIPTTAMSPVQMSKEFLPSRGRYIRASYRLSLSIETNSANKNTELDIGPRTAVLRLWGDTLEEYNQIDLYSGADSETICGYVSLEPFMLSWTGDDDMERVPDECDITLAIEYDPGKTLHRMSGHETIREAVKEADPDIGYRTALSETEITADYRGQIEGEGWNHRFPMDIEYAYPIDDRLLVLLQEDTEGVSNPDIACDSARNIVCFDSNGDVLWRAQPSTADDGDHTYYRYLWRYDDRLMTRTAAQSYVELDPETGSIIQTTPMYPD
ncbi:hypothetical protein GCM10009006_33950 [Haloarcula argentinensis]|uniref:Uncharacterized protein n=2 Tax=Haloarcula argentinensis TaxID=43776 RepID=A0A830FX88_HALAR|nr:hypothetical protein GCM10009006_33950 [Haloarcula argentinensis]